MQPGNITCNFDYVMLGVLFAGGLAFGLYEIIHGAEGYTEKNTVYEDRSCYNF